MYTPIWEAIKKVEVGKSVGVRVRNDGVRTLIQAVKKEKNREVGVKKKIGMPTTGRLLIEIKPQPGGLYTKVYFSLEWDASRL